MSAERNVFFKPRFLFQDPFLPLPQRWVACWVWWSKVKFHRRHIPVMTEDLNPIPYDRIIVILPPIRANPFAFRPIVILERLFGFNLESLHQDLVRAILLSWQRIRKSRS